MSAFSVGMCIVKHLTWGSEWGEELFVCLRVVCLLDGWVVCVMLLVYLCFYCFFTSTSTISLLLDVLMPLFMSSLVLANALVILLPTRTASFFLCIYLGCVLTLRYDFHRLSRNHNEHPIIPLNLLSYFYWKSSYVLYTVQLPTL